MIFIIYFRPSCGYSMIFFFFFKRNSFPIVNCFETRVTFINSNTFVTISPTNCNETICISTVTFFFLSSFYTNWLPRNMSVEAMSTVSKINRHDFTRLSIFDILQKVGLKPFNSLCKIILQVMNIAFLFSSLQFLMEFWGFQKSVCLLKSRGIFECLLVS